jgi:hypothetical protein
MAVPVVPAVWARSSAPVVPAAQAVSVVPGGRGPGTPAVRVVTAATVVRAVPRISI